MKSNLPRSLLHRIAMYSAMIAVLVVSACGVVPIRLVLEGSLGDLVSVSVDSGVDVSPSSFTPVVTVDGTVGQSALDNGFAFSAFSQVLVGGVPIAPHLNDGQVICTHDPLRMHIQRPLQDFHVLFGPNEGDEQACGAVVGGIIDGRASFILNGSWGFFWGRLPKTQTEWIVLSIPTATGGTVVTKDTTGVVEVDASGEHRAYLIDPPGSAILVDCAIGCWVNDTLSPPACISGLTSMKVDNTRTFLAVKAFDDGTIRGCVGEFVPFDSAPFDADARVNEWTKLAEEAEWTRVEP